MKKILLTLLTIISVGVSAQTYYISPNGDNTDGLTPATAWHDPYELDELDMDTAWFERGYNYRQSDVIDVTSDGTSNEYVYFGSYGTGDLPRILCSDSLIGWTEVQTNIWACSNTIHNPIDFSWGANIFYEELSRDTTHWGHYMNYDASYSELDSLYKWCWDNNTIYVYSTANPATIWGSIEVPVRTRAFRINTADYVHFDSLAIHYGALGLITDENAANNVTQQWGLKVSNCHLSHVGFKGSSYGYCLESHHSDVHIYNNLIHDGGRRNISLTMYNTTNIITCFNILIEHNHFRDGWHTTGVDCIIADGGGHLVDSVVVRYNYVQGDRDVPINLTSGDYNDNPPSNAFYFSNQTGGSGGRINRVYVYNNVSKYSTGKHLVFAEVDTAWGVNNTFYNHNYHTPDPQDQAALSFGRNAGKFINIYNNIIYLDSAARNPSEGGDVLWMFMENRDTDTSAFNFDRNIFCLMNDSSQIFTMYESGADYDTYANTAISWDSYKSDYPRYEVNSPDPQDPLFGIISNDTIPLSEGSPAIGKALPFDWLTTDYLGNQRDPNTPDIGAFEFGASPAPPPIVLPNAASFGGKDKGLLYNGHPLKLIIE